MCFPAKLRKPFRDTEYFTPSLLWLPSYLQSHVLDELASPSVPVMVSAFGWQALDC